jgi:hypothetical protein
MTPARAGGAGFDDEGPTFAGAYGQLALSYDNTRALDYVKFEDHINLSMCGEKSSTSWVDTGPYRKRSGPYWRWPSSNRVADLSEPFRKDVRRFLRSLAAARKLKPNQRDPLGRGHRHPRGKVAPIVPVIATTLRLDERAWLMNTSYRVAGGWHVFRPENPPGASLKPGLAAEAPSDVKPYPHGGVDHLPICWLHQDKDGNPDVALSKNAADQMRQAFVINNFGAAYPSNHTKGQAIDMKFRWSTPIAIKDGDGRWRVVPAGDSTSSVQMWAIAATFDVLKQTTGDPPHWSLTGS